MSNVNGKWKLQLVFYASFLFVYIEDNSIYYIEYLLNTYLWRCSKPVTLSHVLKILIFGVFWGDLKVGLFKNLYLSWLLILYDSMTCLVFLLWQVALLPSEKLSVDLSLNSSCVPLDMLGYLYSLLASCVCASWETRLRSVQEDNIFQCFKACSDLLYKGCSEGGIPWHYHCKKSLWSVKMTFV